MPSRAKKNWWAWTVSLAAHVAVITAIVFRPAGEATILVPVNRDVVMPLIYNPPVRKTPVIRTVELPRIRLPQPKAPLPAPVVPVQPKVKRFQAFSHPQPRALAIPVPEQTARLQTRLQTSIAPGTLKVPELPAKLNPVKTNVFATSGNAVAGHIPASRLQVHTGGFDDGGAPATVAAGARGGGVKLGGFGAASNGGGGGTAGGSGGRGLVAKAGFGNAVAETPASRKQDRSATSTPVEVLWKPKPVYTAEARAKKLEGDVALQVIFHANGQVQVLRVLRGLGSGLDQNAQAAAEQIRFRPGREDGVPVDRTATVLITFELL